MQSTHFMLWMGKSKMNLKFIINDNRRRNRRWGKKDEEFGSTELEKLDNIM